MSTQRQKLQTQAESANVTEIVQSLSKTQLMG